MAGGVVALIYLGIAVQYGWRELSFRQRLGRALPFPPDLSGRASMMVERVTSARAQARSWRDGRAGVVELGRLYHANGFYAHAEACWRFLHAEEPQEARWVYYLADARRAASDYSAVKRLLRETVRLNPRYAPAMLQLAALEFKSGEVDAAGMLYLRGVALDHTNPHGWLGLARVALQRGNTGEARRLLEILVRDSPEFAPGHNLLAEVLAAAAEMDRVRHHRWLGREAGRFKDPDDPWLSGLHAWCHDAKRLGVLGTIAFQTQRNDEAKALLERAFALAPDDLAIRTLLAELELKRGDAPRARALLDPVARNPSLAQAGPPVGLFVTLSEACRVLGAVDEALAALDTGMRVLPPAPELQRQRGLILQGAGRHEEARRAFREAATQNPQDANSAAQLGLSHLGSGQRDEGVRWLRQAVAVQPTHLPALALLARIEMEAGRLDAAWGYLEPLYESNSGLAQVQQLVGRWHWQAGNVAAKIPDVARAERYFRAGVNVNTADAELQASLGVLLLTQGRFAEALPSLEAYHRLQPENSRSALFLGQAYASSGRVDDARRVLELGEQLALRAGQASTAQHCREMLQQLAR
jgi:tetratricopeptide (TPR) repeat protein